MASDRFNVMGLWDNIRASRRKRKVYTLDEIASIIVPIAKSYGTGRIMVFGSYAKGLAGPDSDVDLLIDPGEISSYFRFATMATDMEKAIGKQVDAVSSGCSPRFIDKIRKDLVTIYERSSALQAQRPYRTLLGPRHRVECRFSSGTRALNPIAGQSAQ